MKKKNPPDALTLLDKVSGIIAKELDRFEAKSGTEKGLSAEDHRSLEAMSRTLIAVRKDERADEMRADLSTMKDSDLRTLAAEAARYVETFDASKN